MRGEASTRPAQALFQRNWVRFRPGQDCPGKAGVDDGKQGKGDKRESSPIDGWPHRSIEQQGRYQREQKQNAHHSVCNTMYTIARSTLTFIEMLISTERPSNSSAESSHHRAVDDESRHAKCRIHPPKNQADY